MSVWNQSHDIGLDGLGCCQDSFYLRGQIKEKYGTFSRRHVFAGIWWTIYQEIHVFSDIFFSTFFSLPFIFMWWLKYITCIYVFTVNRLFPFYFIFIFSFNTNTKFSKMDREFTDLMTSNLHNAQTYGFIKIPLFRSQANFKHISLYM